MKPESVVTKLTAMGFHFEVSEDKVRWQWEGQGYPDPAQARPLLDLVKSHKDAIRRFLKKKRPSLPERILSCQECPWYELNPWAHLPGLGAWCRYHMDHLLIDNPQCTGYRQGQVPERRGKATG